MGRRGEGIVDFSSSICGKRGGGNGRVDCREGVQQSCLLRFQQKANVLSISDAKHSEAAIPFDVAAQQSLEVAAQQSLDIAIQQSLDVAVQPSRHSSKEATETALQQSLETGT